MTEQRQKSSQGAPDKPRPPGQSNGTQDLWHYIGLGTQLALTVLLFVGIGYWLDERFGWSPWGIISFGLFGIAAGLYHFVKDALR